MSVKSDIEVKGSLISYFSNLIKKNGGINLAQGIPGFMPPDKLMQSLANVSYENFHQYAPGIGNLELVNFLENKYKISGSNSKILITNGATEAISLIYNYLMSVNGSSTFNVAAFSPAYESYIHLPRIFGHQFFPYLIDDSVYFDNQDFEEFFVSNKIKLIFVSSPGNPYGKAISNEKLDFLVQLAEKNNAFLIIDAVYNELYFGENCPYYPIENLSPNVFYVNSFSKKFSVTGWRIGYFLMHESHFEKMRYTHDYIGLCVPAPLQQAMSDYLKTNNYQQYIDEIKSIIRTNYLESTLLLTNSGFYCPGADGGYFVWCKLPKGFNNSLEFGLELYGNYKTAIIPGVHFGKEWNHYIRINIARQPNELRQGLKNIISFVQSKC
jgi:aspartate/methionine/tyrosine aminotransferase